MAAPNTLNCYGKPAKRIGPPIIIDGTIRLANAELFTFALNFNYRGVLQPTTDHAFPRHKRWPGQRGLLHIMANESVPPMRVDVQKNVILVASPANSLDQKEKPAADFSRAGNGFAVPFMRLAGKQHFEFFAAARTTDCASEWRLIDACIVRNNAILQVCWNRHHSARTKLPNW
jgi:hypothetical protein